MAEALLHPNHGYYKAKPIGLSGDFITAQVNQIFGELGLWMVEMWRIGGAKQFGLIKLALVVAH